MTSRSTGLCTVTRSRHHPPPSFLHVAFALVVGAAILAVAAPAFSVTVYASGAELRVPMGTAFGDLVSDGLITPVPGDLRDVEGEVIESGGGNPPVVFHNGRLAWSAARLRDGDTVSVRRGSDVTEATEVVETPIPVAVERIGKGPLVSLEAPGVVGVRETVVGVLSGKHVSDRISVPMEPMLIRRYVPAPGSKVVALTFDDGPWPGHTEAILDILRAHEVRATFFMVGYLAERYPTLTRRVVNDGHTVANHTYSHARLTRLSPQEVSREITEGNRALKNVTGIAPTWFRPPGGAIDAEVMREAERLGMRLVMWDVDPQDWRKPGVDPMLGELLRAIAPGSVVLLHDGGGDRAQTVELLPRLIVELKARGYVFLTIDELVR
ncbi:MAG: polysaccharide deacetylase family protein [Clostridiales bacterium]|nr:polysaccharide deacetylase family protein [Clostridiales bacterium]